MSELILGAVIIGLVVANIYTLGRYFDMNEKYMKAFMAKNLQDFSQSAIMEKVDLDVKPKEQFVPVEEADESVFNKFLKQALNGRQNELPEV